MLEKYDFYRRLCGRLVAQKNRLAQVENVLNETPIFNKRKRELLEARLSEMNQLVSELEFVKKNIEEEIEDLHKAIDKLEALNSKQSCSGCRYEPIKECTECIHCKRFCRDRYDKKHID